MKFGAAVTTAAILGAGAAGAFVGFKQGEISGRTESAGGHTPFTLDQLRQSRGEITADAIIRFDAGQSSVITPGRSVTRLRNGAVTTNWGTGTLVFILSSASTPETQSITSTQTVTLASPQEWQMLQERFAKLFPQSGRHAIVAGEYRSAVRPAYGSPARDGAASHPGESFHL